MERFARFGVAAAVQALVDAGLVAEMTSTGPLDEVDPDSPLDLVLEPRPRHPAAAISTSFGFGGHNGALVFVPAWRDI